MVCFMQQTRRQLFGTNSKELVIRLVQRLQQQAAQLHVRFHEIRLLWLHLTIASCYYHNGEDHRLALIQAVHHFLHPVLVLVKRITDLRRNHFAEQPCTRLLHFTISHITNLFVENAHADSNPLHDGLHRCGVDCLDLPVLVVQSPTHPHLLLVRLLQKRIAHALALR